MELIYALIVLSIGVLVALAVYYSFVLHPAMKKLSSAEIGTAFSEKQLNTLVEVDAHLRAENHDGAMKAIGDYVAADYKDLIEAHHLSHSVGVVIGRYRRLCQEEGIRLELKMGENLKMEGEMPAVFVHVIGNLMDNAMEEVRNHRQNKWVKLCLYETDGQFRLNVKNPVHGKLPLPQEMVMPGFSTKYVSVLSSKTQERGYGMSIVADLISHHGGRLLIDTEEGMSVTVIL